MFTLNLYVRGLFIYVQFLKTATFKKIYKMGYNVRMYILYVWVENVSSNIWITLC